MRPVADLDAALARADLSASIPKTPETVGMFSAARLKRMKATPISSTPARGASSRRPR